MNEPAAETTKHASASTSVRLELTLTATEVQGPAGSLPLDPHDAVLRNLLLLLLGETQGLSTEEATTRLGYSSRTTYHNKLQRFRDGGASSLAPEKPGPKHKPRRKPEVVLLIRAALETRPTPTSAEIASQLQRKGYSLSLRSVQRTVSELRRNATAGGHPEGKRVC